ncbi:hypothetical protein [Bradyrhizobium sp. ARR65]|uniref:hypothetical protein n=1 Tax=Bradyrhizobium sp. ARR65 TaxID=1040989 RepID=UPI000467D05E|nr:hypothetical protein [Bradyrhizobium sp. ARR65]
MTAKWEAQALRATFFPTEATAVAAEWWQEFTGSQPDNENRQPKDAIVVVSGAFEGAFLSISSGIGRVDVVFQPLLPNQINPLDGQTLPTVSVGPAEALFDKLFSRLRAVSERLKLVNRVALAGTLLKPVTSRDEAYEELKVLLKSVSVNPARMRDLIYRVNWPTQDTAGRVVNRMGAWGSMTARVSAQGLGEAPTGSAILSENHYVSFEFDFNTAPDPEVRFTPEEVTSEFQFLRGLLEENLKQGEVI